MNNPPHDKSEMVELMHRHLLGATEPAEVERLEMELLQSPQLRADYLRAVRMDAALQEASTRMDLPPSKTVVTFPKRLVLAAAAIVIFSLVLWRWMNPSPRPPRSLGAEVATLIDARDCSWADGGVIAVDGRLVEGAVNLKSGVALIEFDGGARMALKGPASLNLTGPKSARLLRGDVTVRCEDGAEGFSLLTPTSTVIDLGTEFGVAVASDGTTAVEVLDGAVEVASGAKQAAAGSRVLSAGETLKLDADGSGRTDGFKPAKWERDYTSKAERDEKAMPPRLFAQDGFFTQGVKTALKDYSGGTGWNGPWTLVTQGKRPPSYLTPVRPLAKRVADSGDSLVVGGRQELHRLLAESIDPTKRQTIYLGFSFSRLEYSRNDGTQRFGMSVLLRSSTEPTNFIAAGLSARNRWSASDAGGAEPSESEVTGDGPFYVIVRVDFRPKTGNRVSIAAYRSAPEIPTQEPTKWDLITRRRMANSKLPFDLIALRTLDPIGVKIGELHVGNSWSAVANPGAAAK